jgi:ubiquinone/menaquinone biosynthesis C-methylase UbiE
MPRRRTLAILIGLSAATSAIVRHGLAGARRHRAPGGILIGDAAGYDTQTRLLLGSFFRGIAADVAESVPEAARVLEVGCGPGHLSILLARGHGLAVTGVDLDPAMIDRARRNATAAGGPPAGRPTFQVGDAAALPFADASFDAVVSTLSMHHWTEPVAGLTEIGRVLRPEGKALIWDLRAGTVPFHRGVADPTEHVAGSSLRLVSAEPWRWPWRFTFTRRLELVPDGGLAAASSTQES